MQYDSIIQFLLSFVAIFMVLVFCSDLREKIEKTKLYQSEINHFLASRESHREQQRQRETKEEQYCLRN